MLFADVRGSTALGEHASAVDFAALLNRFYATATRVLLRHDAVIDKLIGDEVMAFFVSGVSGRTTAAGRCWPVVSCSRRWAAEVPPDRGFRSGWRSTRERPTWATSVLR